MFQSINQPKRLHATTLHRVDSSTFNGTVLLVDDDKPVLEVCESMLKKLGFRVLTAADGAAVAIAVAAGSSRQQQAANSRQQAAGRC